MAIITFWNNGKEETGQTMSVIAMASVMAIEHNLKILVVETSFDDKTLELAYGGQDKNKAIIKSIIKDASKASIDNGIDGLIKNAYSGRLTPEIIPSYTGIVYKNRLEILYGVKNIEREISKVQYEKTRAKYKDIILNASKYYDMVIVDLDRHINDEVTQQILEMSNIIIYNTEQKIDTINAFIQLRKEQPFFARANVMLNIGKFDKHSKYNEANVIRYTGIKKDVLNVPYNTLYFEAAREEKVADLFLRARKISDSDKNALFINAVNKDVERIIYKLQELQMKM
mgnify:CR=1 FL=1